MRDQETEAISNSAKPHSFQVLNLSRLNILRDIRYLLLPRSLRHLWTRRMSERITSPLLPLQLWSYPLSSLLSPIPTSAIRSSLSTIAFLNWLEKINCFPRSMRTILYNNTFKVFQEVWGYLCPQELVTSSLSPNQVLMDLWTSGQCLCYKKK